MMNVILESTAAYHQGSQADRKERIEKASEKPKGRIPQITKYTIVDRGRALGIHIPT